LEHVFENLDEFAPTAESGTKFRRLWQVGNLERGPAVVSGRLGWARAGQVLSTVFDGDAQAWIDQEEPGTRSGVAPFALIADGRFLGIMKHPSFRDRTLADVFTALLNRAERSRPDPTTAFDVEPVGDTEEFYGWLNRVDRVTSVEFVFKRPNPDAEDSFRPLFDRLDDTGSDEIREEFKVTDERRGLDKGSFQRNPEVRMFLSAAGNAYGYVLARGRRKQKRSRYDQRSRVARESVSDVGDSWESATETVVEATRQGRDKRKPDG
jgi:hypothetical protein